MSDTILLDGHSLDRAALVQIAEGAPVALDAEALTRVERAAAFLSEQVAREEPIYGVSTGFGSNADKLLGGRRVRGGQGDGESLHEELQRNLIITHAVCVGEPFAPEVVRAMLGIRINTLLRGHSGIRVDTLQALAALLNAGIVPVVPQLGSVGASGISPRCRTWRSSSWAAARPSIRASGCRVEKPCRARAWLPSP